MTRTTPDPFGVAATLMRMRPPEDPLDAQIAVLLAALDPVEAERITAEVAQDPRSRGAPWVDVNS